MKVIAGTLDADGDAARGAVQASTTDALYLDVELPARRAFPQPVASGHNAFVYRVRRRVRGRGRRRGAEVDAAQRGVCCAEGDAIEVTAGSEGARFLVLAGRPLREPIVQYGPFVMNTREEIEQAVRDYQSGSFAAADAGGVSVRRRPLFRTRPAGRCPDRL